MRIFVKKIHEKYVYAPKMDGALIFRRCLYNVGTRNIYLISFFPSQSRPFLNFLNTSCGPLALVKSIPCIRMKVGEREIYKPSDLGYDQFW